MLRIKFTITIKSDGSIHIHEVHPAGYERDCTVLNNNPPVQLKEGWKLVCLEEDDNLCGDGGRSHWVLINPENEVTTEFEFCHCGRGCGGGDVVRDDWGYHDCEPEIEAVRID